jgi:hypothetical protein
MLGFLIQYAKVVNELSRLIGLRFINVPSNSARYKHNYQERDWLLGKLMFLIANLPKIEKYDTKLFNKLKKQLLTSINENEYFGARFEISVAAALIGKKIVFKKRESPDYLILKSEEKIFLECTSSHITQLKGDFKRKLTDQILEKAMKPYCNLRTALMVDITNIYCSAR